MREWLYDVFRERPAWMSLIMVFCAYMAFVYMPWDLFVKPVEVDQEVWFGLLFTGVWAKILAKQIAWRFGIFSPLRSRRL